MKNNCPVHGATECKCSLEYRIYSRIMSLPSYGLIADNQENPMLSRVAVVRIVEQEANNMRGKKNRHAPASAEGITASGERR
jgi:hypothetical protein